MGETIISFIFSSSLMCTGSLIVKSHVDAVGQHANPSGQPWTNEMENCLGNPCCDISSDPVNHFKKYLSCTTPPEGMVRYISFWMSKIVNEL